MCDETLFERGATPRIEPDFQTSVRAEQINAIYRAPAIMLFNPINASILAAVLWPAYPAWILVVWVALFCLVIGLRLIGLNSMIAGAR
jgi:hypothetical protein